MVHRDRRARFVNDPLPETCDVSVVVPVYNEKPNLGRLVDEVRAAMQPTGLSWELVIVDDGSKDGSRELYPSLVASCPELRVVALRRNFGQSAAFDAGFRHVSGRLVVTMDGDLQNDPKDIPAMVERLDREDLDLVHGWRRKRRDGFFLRTLPSRIANALIRYVTGTKVHDLGCSLKVYRREIVDDLHLYGEMHRFIAVLAEGVGANVGEHETNHRARTAGESKYGIMRTFKVLLDLMTVWFMRGFQTKPIYVFGGIGTSLMTLGTVVAGVVLWQKLAYGDWVHRNPLVLIAVVLALVGIQFFGTGLLAEVVVRTWFESRGKPSYIVGRALGFPGGTLYGADRASRLSIARVQLPGAAPQPGPRPEESAPRPEGEPGREVGEPAPELRRPTGT
ncbi:MAG: glycosyltransferase [Deltaproteobacteria bacterium]|nr:glycosyltransferase [Deltaproteobacteria bacterium]